MNEKAKEKMLQGVANGAIKKLEKRDVLLEQDLATADKNQTVKEFLAEEEANLGAKIDIKQWALFAIK